MSRENEILNKLAKLDAKVNWIKARIILISKKLEIGKSEDWGDLYE